MRARRSVDSLAADEIRPTVDLAGKWVFESPADGYTAYAVPSFHLILIESGRIEARAPRGAGGSFIAGSRELICFRPTPHNEYRPSARRTTIYQLHLQFAPPPHHRLIPWLGEAGPLPVHVHLGDAFDEAQRCFETISLELGRAGIAPRMRVTSSIFELLAVVSGVVLAARTPGAISAPHRRSPALDAWQRVRLQLDSDLSRDLRMTDLARQMNVGVDHFIRRFKQRFGLSPKAYRTQSRLREAVRRLRATEQPIKSIAYALGFEDPKTFTRRFRHHVGMTPTALRRSSLAPSPDVPGGTTASADELFPLNRHILPPDAGPEALTRFHAQYRVTRGDPAARR